MSVPTVHTSHVTKSAASGFAEMFLFAVSIGLSAYFIIATMLLSNAHSLLWHLLVLTAAFTAQFHYNTCSKSMAVPLALLSQLVLLIYSFYTPITFLLVLIIVRSVIGTRRMICLASTLIHVNTTHNTYLSQYHHPLCHPIFCFVPFHHCIGGPATWLPNESMHAEPPS